MSFVYFDGRGKSWGAIRGGVAFSFIMESHGLLLMKAPEGMSPFALAKNAVMFDAGLVDKEWPRKLVASPEQKISLQPSFLYFCVSTGANFSFQTIDLRHHRVVAKE